MTLEKELEKKIAMELEEMFKRGEKFGKTIQGEKTFLAMSCGGLIGMGVTVLMSYFSKANLSEIHALYGGLVGTYLGAAFLFIKDSLTYRKHYSK